ncbi:MAG: nitroreductase/quinone reductase family protein [Actinomycetota bacterium]
MGSGGVPRLSFVERLASTRAGAWYFINVTAKIDPWLLKRTGGRVSSIVGQPVLLLQHTGARSGAARETPLVYATDGDDIVLIASNGGSVRHPAWYHNLVAKPECGVIAAGRSGPYVATEVDGDERSRLWSRALAVYGGYAVYQQRTGGRRIPLLRLTRRTQIDETPKGTT